MTYTSDNERGRPEQGDKAQPLMHRILDFLTYEDEVSDDLDSFLAMRASKAWQWDTFSSVKFDDVEGPIVWISAVPNHINLDDTDDCLLTFRAPLREAWDCLTGPNDGEGRNQFIDGLKTFVHALEVEHRALSSGPTS